MSGKPGFNSDFMKNLQSTPKSSASQPTGEPMDWQRGMAQVAKIVFFTQLVLLVIATPISCIRFAMTVATGPIGMPSAEIEEMGTYLQTHFADDPMVVDMLGGIDSIEYDGYASRVLADSNDTYAFQARGPKGEHTIIVRALAAPPIASSDSPSPKTLMAYLRDDEADIEHVLGMLSLGDGSTSNNVPLNQPPSLPGQ